jgi:hypothetical protein
MTAFTNQGVDSPLGRALEHLHNGDWVQVSGQLETVNHGFKKREFDQMLGLVTHPGLP